MNSSVLPWHMSFWYLLPLSRSRKVLPQRECSLLVPAHAVPVDGCGAGHCVQVMGAVGQGRHPLVVPLCLLLSERDWMLTCRPSAPLLLLKEWYNFKILSAIISSCCFTLESPTLLLHQELMFHTSLSGHSPARKHPADMNPGATL